MKFELEPLNSLFHVEHGNKLDLNKMIQCQPGGMRLPLSADPEKATGSWPSSRKSPALSHWRLA